MTDCVIFCALLYPACHWVGILGTKAGMMRFWDAEGRCSPATMVATFGGNAVTQLKTPVRDGYTAVQVGYDAVKQMKLSKPEVGHTAKAGLPPLRHLREFRVG
ncbi:hypothetical protein H632_c743p0 [Helicosporidium sp. ATCC 50920]|nr:hypothetical protein H632_c743p0 [Helicosporidium sp. ATCC 50920]|eukprot:KDD75325.1 hypothetical protein H632_c743p0 [Helicosporidium sp. ATCC 50920]